MKYNIFKNKFKNCHLNTTKAKPDLVCAIKTRNKFIFRGNLCERPCVSSPKNASNNRAEVQSSPKL